MTCYSRSDGADFWVFISRKARISFARSNGLSGICSLLSDTALSGTGISLELLLWPRFRSNSNSFTDHTFIPFLLDPRLISALWSIHLFPFRFSNPNSSSFEPRHFVWIRIRARDLMTLCWIHSTCPGGIDPFRIRGIAGPSRVLDILLGLTEFSQPLLDALTLLHGLFAAMLPETLYRMTVRDCLEHRIIGLPRSGRRFGSSGMPLFVTAIRNFILDFNSKLNSIAALNFRSSLHSSCRALAVQIWHKNSIQMYGFLIFNGASFAYSLFQFFQLEALFRTAEFDPAVDIDLGILRQYGIILIVIPTLLGVMEVVYGYLTWKLVKEFGWKMYKRIGADPHMRCGLERRSATITADLFLATMP